MDDSVWELRISVLRKEPTVEAAIRVATTKSGLHADLSLIRELSTCFPFLREEEEEIRTIRGPADLTRALEIASKLQAIKDRSAEISLQHNNMRGKLERLYDAAESTILLDRDVVTLRNESQRHAVVNRTIPEIVDALSNVKRVLDASDAVTKNVNQSYNILKLQVEVIREMMYQGGLTKALKSVTQA